LQDENPKLLIKVVTIADNEMNCRRFINLDKVVSLF
jgi:hypothetical protein